jgi:hypothetical protein
MLFNLGGSQQFLNMFGRRRNNRRMIWGSMLGLGVSAAAYGLGRNRNRNVTVPVQNLMKNFQSRNGSQMPRMAALTEFAKEIAPNKNPSSNK